MPQADVIILLSTAGQGIDQQIAEKIPGIDLIISGDANQLTTPWQSEKTGTLVLRADTSSPGHAARRVGIAHLAFDEQGQLVGQHWEQLSLGPDIADDPKVTKWVQEQLVR
jgi:2',3'-cyclic-nucleotide 2'-phosphodiesterase (5'-nucleotidase family)